MWDLLSPQKVALRFLQRASWTFVSPAAAARFLVQVVPYEMPIAIKRDFTFSLALRTVRFVFF
jgi:hypothetical protein